MTHHMNRIAILILALTLTACTSLQQAHTDINTLHASFELLIMNKISLGELTMDDLRNGRANLVQHEMLTGNPYDKAAIRCADQLIVFFPALQAIVAPPPSEQQAAPVTGFFSAIAAKQIAAEDAETRIAAKRAALRNGFPAEVTIACAPITDVIGQVLAHGGTAH